MHFNSKREKLEEALNNLPITEGDNMEAVTEATQEIPTAVLITADQLDDFKFNGVELEGLREDNTMKLIRVIVRPNDPLKLESTGEIFSFGNSVANGGKVVKKYVPFNNEEGWHVPNIIFENIKAAECQIFKKVVRNGQETMEPQKIKAYNVEVLDDLTQEEVDKIAVRQKATSSVG
jgi:hypothetical protein